MSVINTIGRNIIELVEKMLAPWSDHTAVLPLSRYPELLELEKNYQTILDEYILYHNDASVVYIDEISPIQKKIVKPKKWKSLFLLLYGKKIKSNEQKFQRTNAMLNNIPIVKTAFFSIFSPDTYIKPHRGPYKGVLRYHLGLIIPKERDKCAIKINGEIYQWEEGKALLFDDTFLHEAWNYTDEERVILFIDVERKLKFPFNFVNRFIIFLISRSPFAQEILRH
ncbi:MAG: aspartyl beta-hydroxylase [Bacteroidota bacterium]|nr:aspartyl beta-hydroxylase [Bacteroidota bacterium]